VNFQTIILTLNFTLSRQRLEPLAVALTYTMAAPQAICQLDVERWVVLATFRDLAHFRSAFPAIAVSDLLAHIGSKRPKQLCGGYAWAWSKDVPDDEFAFKAFCHLKEPSDLRAVRGVSFCTSCNTEKPVSSFKKGSSTLLCKACHNLKQKEVQTREAGRFTLMFEGAKKHSEAILSAGRIEAAINTLTREQMKTQWVKQQGKCFYSTIPMQYDTLKPWACSLERINDDRGYTADNIVFIVHELNVTAKWTSEKVRVLPHLMQQPIDLHQLAFEVREASTKMPSELPPKIAELRALIFLAVKHSRATAKKRTSSKRKRDGTQVGVSSITEQNLFDKIIEQKGRCAISGIPLVFSSKVDWRCSLERIDNDKGYTVENTALVCYELNGPCQWTRAKFKYFLQAVAPQQAALYALEEE
jgi:hypothetical protein